MRFFSQNTSPSSTNNIYVMASFFSETSEFLWITLLCNKKFFFQFGAFVVYFFDYRIGSGWWMMVLYVLQLCAIFVIRGKPYSGEQVATALITKAHCCSSALIPLLAFSWHVVRILVLKVHSSLDLTNLNLTKYHDLVNKCQLP